VSAVAIDRVITGPGRWVPNLARGASIWRLAPDLNAVFGGRLLEPKIGGPENLPAKVEWQVTGLLTIDEARAQHSAALETAWLELLDCLERAIELFERPGYEHFKEAFSVPAFDADDGGHYFYSPDDRAIRVINWGASPSRAGASSERVIGYVALSALVERERTRLARVRSGVHSVRPKARSRAWPWLVFVALAAAALAVYLIATDDEDAQAPPVESREPPVEVPPPVREMPPPPPIPPPIPAPYQRIHFEVARDELRSSERESLEGIHRYLVEHPEVALVLVEGHADLVGEERDNTALSAERAARVIRWLVDRGVAAERLRGAGCSELHPIDTSDDPSRLGANRRVEFFVLAPVIEGAPRPHEGCAPAGL
jgi:outer membrane protein OmpA-like peptidoglycan-associated protein